MKKSMAILALAFVIGIGSAFTLKSPDANKNAVFSNTRNLACQPVTSNCTGNGAVCEQYKRLDDCEIQARILE